MPASLSDDLKRLIVTWYFEEGLTYREIKDRAQCSIGLVSKVLRNYEDFGQVVNPFRKRTGRPSMIEDGDIKYISSLLDANPVLYLDELQQRLHSARNIYLAIATLSRLLIRYGLTRKHIQKVAMERNEELRTLWEADMAEYTDPDIFVALDESAVDNHTVQRQYGRSMAGAPCVQWATFLRGIWYSVLPALTTEGIIALDIFEGSVTEERFMTFIHEQVVCPTSGHCLRKLAKSYLQCPQLNPYPQKRSVVLLDNCSIHHDEELRRMIVDECGVYAVSALSDIYSR